MHQPRKLNEKLKLVEALVSYLNQRKGKRIFHFSIPSWTEWELEVMSYIIDILKYRDPYGLLEFTMKDIRDHKPSLQTKYPFNKNIEATVSRILQTFRDKGEIEFLAEPGRYRLSENGSLIEVLQRCRN